MPKHHQGCGMQEPAINNMRHKIRYAQEADNPKLIALWLAMEYSLSPATKSSHWLLYVTEFHLLLDTLADDLLPNHWRRLCLDNINRPLAALRGMAYSNLNKQQLNQLFYELRTTSHFFQTGIAG